jgi:signal transduction histidine kinase/DNA-binding response OmpR family regulator
MSVPLLTVPIAREHDVVAVRQRAKHIAEALGFDRIEQTRIATAVSEIARNAFMYAGGGRVEYAVEGDTTPQVLTVRIADSGPGIANLREILAGDYRSPSGLGIGLVGARRLVDRFTVSSTSAGTIVKLAKLLPARAPLFTGPEVAGLADALASRRPVGALEEVQQQNQELLRALDDLRVRQEELQRVNRELEDTNRGVVALYAELDERADHLRRADEIKTRFLSNMTHEFRTPVNSVLALTRLLAERLQSDENEKSELFYIRKSAQQLSDLVDDLLDLAKVEAGKIDVKPAYFEVPALFGALRGMLRPLLVSQSLNLVFEEPVDVPPLYSDETKVSQVLRNFISNAIKYTEAGEVRVSASYVRSRNATVFAVSDTGIGIPEVDLPRIFDEFVQIENPLQRRVKGTGLGLPLSKRLADLLGGSIHVESALGIGSTFTLSIPNVFRDVGLARVPQGDVVPGQLPVLVVEDSDEDMLIYRRMLASTRFQPFHVSSAADVVAAVERLQPAAIVLDIRLHGEDAWPLITELKRDGTSRIPLIVASGVDDGRKALALGADAFGLKPIDARWFVDTLETLAQRQAPVRVLSIDDEEASRFIIREILSSPAYLLAEAGSGEEGLALAREFRPDVILLDLQLPGLSGFDVAAALGRDPVTAPVPIVVVTSLKTTMRDQERLGTGVRLIPKAILSRDVLRAAVYEAATGAGPASAPAVRP